MSSPVQHSLTYKLRPVATAATVMAVGAAAIAGVVVLTVAFPYVMLPVLGVTAVALVGGPLLFFSLFALGGH